MSSKPEKEKTEKTEKKSVQASKKKRAISTKAKKSEEPIVLHDVSELILKGIRKLSNNDPSHPVKLYKLEAFVLKSLNVKKSGEFESKFKRALASLTKNCNIKEVEEHTYGFVNPNNIAEEKDTQLQENVKKIVYSMLKENTSMNGVSYETLKRGVQDHYNQSLPTATLESHLREVIAEGSFNHWIQELKRGRLIFHNPSPHKKKGTTKKAVQRGGEKSKKL